MEPSLLCVQQYGKSWGEDLNALMGNLDCRGQNLLIGAVESQHRTEMMLTRADHKVGREDSDFCFVF